MKTHEFEHCRMCGESAREETTALKVIDHCGGHSYDVKFLCENCYDEALSSDSVLTDDGHLIEWVTSHELDNIDSDLAGADFSSGC